MTYPEAAIIEHVQGHFVPVKLLGAEHRELAKGFNLRWFPGLVVAGADGRPAHTVVGFLPPADLVSELDYGRAIHAMTTKDYATANALFQKLSDDVEAERAPEAAYWWGISKMRETKDPAAGLGPWKLIPERWPASQWTRKVAYALS